MARSRPDLSDDRRDPDRGDHIKVWAPNGQAQIFAAAGEHERRQAIVVDGATGVGLFGIVLRSDSDRRRTALEDSAVALDGAIGTEIVGLEVSASASAAVFVFGGSQRTWIVGNDLRDNWADAVHFTDGSRVAWVWENHISNSGDVPGDDGVACVTYGATSRCGDMEWWDNVHLGGGWGRGLAVVGGDRIRIHDNVIVDTAAAGILVASEPSYDTPGSERIDIEDNVVCQAGQSVPHPGILISGLSGPIVDVLVSDNVVVDTRSGEAVRVEGRHERVVERGTSAEASRCESRARPGVDDRPVRDTSILATLDTSPVAPELRRGLYRIEIRREVGGRFEQRFEYVVAGSPDDVDRWLADRPGAAVRFRSGGPDAEDYLVVHAADPLSVPSALRAVSFEDLRSMASTRAELWAHLDAR